MCQQDNTGEFRNFSMYVTIAGTQKKANTPTTEIHPQSAGNTRMPKPR